MTARCAVCFILIIFICNVYCYNNNNNNRPTRPSTISNSQQVQASGLQEIYSWRQVDFKYPNSQVRQFAIETGSFVPENAINPIGVAASGSRVFISMPRWKHGVPATLATVPFPPPYTGGNASSPLLTPYPDWTWSRVGNCDGLTSVYRVKVDECGRLWVLDTGIINSFVRAQRICPPQVVAFDLTNDQMILRYRLPENVLRPESLPGAIEVDYPSSTCGSSPSSAFLYIADVTTYTLIVSDLSSNRSWTVRHRTMFPSPDAGTININDESLELMDGIVGLALSPKRSLDVYRLLYYYPLSGFRQHLVRTDILRNETAANQSPQAYHSSVDTRVSQAVGCSIDQQGVLFFGLLNQNSVACWDTNKPFTRNNVVNLVQNSNTMQYVATATVDRDGRLWAISTRVHKFFRGTLNPRDINYRIFMAPSSLGAVRCTQCDPGATV